MVRPADANETVVAWRTILEHTDRPAGLCLTRQNLPILDRSTFASADGTARGGYVLADASDGQPQVILIGTGSEVQLAVAARERLEAEGTPTRVVSMPCVEWFHEQDVAYQQQVLPSGVKARVSVEAAVAHGLARHRRRRRRDRQHRALRRQRGRTPCSSSSSASPPTTWSPRRTPPWSGCGVITGSTTGN